MTVNVSKNIALLQDCLPQLTNQNNNFPFTYRGHMGRCSELSED